ncbi:MAG: hypothetical protein WA840_01460 [Caulobacteraceae bacterium]
MAERVDRVLEHAAETGRTPAALVLGQEDFPAFQEWARGELGEEIAAGSTYRGVPIRHNGSVFLSRLELGAKPGSPNALLL